MQTSASVSFNVFSLTANSLRSCLRGGAQTCAAPAWALPRLRVGTETP